MEKDGTLIQVYLKISSRRSVGIEISSWWVSYLDTRVACGLPHATRVSKPCVQTVQLVCPCVHQNPPPH